MNVLKYINILILITSNIAYSQVNTLTYAEFLEIKIGDTPFNEIEKTRGDELLMEQVFSDDLTTEKGYSDASEYWIKYLKETCFLKFRNGLLLHNETIKYQLEIISINNNCFNLTIKGVEINIGDSTDKLGGATKTTFINQELDTLAAISFKFGSRVFFVLYDEDTNIINGFEYRLL